MLEEKGELIFIIPSDFLKLTCASKLLNIMLFNGSFTHIYHPHNEKLFDNASNGLITFDEEKQNNNILFKDYFDIFVGLVSGKEAVYKNDKYGNIEVLNGEDKLDKYIFIENYPCENKKINKYLMKHKTELIERKIKKFDENNWFEWGAPRNITAINSNIGKDCIYIYNLTRKISVAFMGKVNLFGGGLIMLIPKKKCNLITITAYINSDKFKNNFIFSGRFKIGHRQISNSYIPNKYL